MAWATAVGLRLQERYGGNVAVVAVLACAVVLMVSPPIIAVISMIDPNALNGLSHWLERLSPAFTYLDYAKAAVTVGSLVLVWRAERAARRVYRRLGSRDRDNGAYGGFEVPAPAFARYFRASTE